MALARPLFSGWETVRYELLNTRICDLDLSVRSPTLAPYLQRLYAELEARRLRFRPPYYLSDSWGCPDRVPAIGIPFYLADKRLARIEEEQTGEVEDSQSIMMLLRHEAAHAFNYAYRLWERPQWRETFGAFSRPYRDVFEPNPRSRNFVQHITTQTYGPTYAQKHPDEDFAETFAVVITPRSGWRRRYRSWPVMSKLLLVDRMIKEIGSQAPLVTGGELVKPVESLEMTLGEHYGERSAHLRAAAQGYVDDRLRSVFGEERPGPSVPLATMLRKHGKRLKAHMMRWSGLREEDVEAILAKLEERADTLGLMLPARRQEASLMDLAAMATAVAMDFATTGQLLD
jgi:hypothetical protein